jgi:hypothetical protein
MRTGCRDIILGASSIALDSVDLQATFCAFVGAVAMTKGYEVRAQIDSENTRGLLLINGGAAVALLAFLPGSSASRALVLWSPRLCGPLGSFQLGLVFAVIHNRARRILLVSSGGASVQAAPMPLPANLGSMDKSRAVRVCAKHVLLTVIAR